MAEVPVQVGGRAYLLNCRDGGEPRLRALAARVDCEARGLTTTLGAMAADRLLLAAAVTLADKLARAEAALEDAADRAERLAALLEDAAPRP